MGVAKRPAGRLVALTAGIAAAACAAAAVSAAAFARTAPHRAPAATAGAACRAGALSLRLAGTDTGAGSTALTVAVTNRSAAACSLGGYPALALARADGSIVAARVSHGTGPVFAGLSAADVRLAPRGQASFFLVYRDFNPATGRPGAADSALWVGLPGAGGRFRLAARLAPYGPIAVSPIRAGAAGEVSGGMSTRAARTGRRGAATGILASLVLLAGTSVPAPVLAETSGFWYGADSGGPGPGNDSAPYSEPSCGPGHKYGGYIGKLGGADLVSRSNPDGYGPGSTFAWNSPAAAAADTNHLAYSDGVGASGYWFMFGPDDTDGTGLSAYAWGRQQGQWALADRQAWYDHGAHRVPLRILWMDIEVPGSYGWGTDSAANREVFNGFWDYVTDARQSVAPGVYSTVYQWDTIMNGHTGIRHTWMWTAQVSVEDSPSPCPDTFSDGSSRQAEFFGGQDAGSTHAAMWQWSLGSADYDQIDSNKPLPDGR